MSVRPRAFGCSVTANGTSNMVVALSSADGTCRWAKTAVPFDTPASCIRPGHDAGHVLLTFQGYVVELDGAGLPGTARRTSPRATGASGNSAGINCRGVMTPVRRFYKQCGVVKVSWMFRTSCNAVDPPVPPPKPT